MLHVTTRYINPLIRRFAGYSPTPFALVRHIGRRSGKSYETPVIVVPIDEGFILALTYGPEVDWYRNVVAAGRCTIIWHSKEYPVEHIETLDARTGLSAFPQPFRIILRTRGTQHFVGVK